MNDSRPLDGNYRKDINLDNLYAALVKCFSVILCGYATGRLNIISQRETKGLDVLVRTFALPCLIFLSFAQIDLSAVNWNFLGSILVSKSIVFAGVILVTCCLSRPINLGRLGLYAVFCTQSNDFALGYPILDALYGKDHPDYPSYVYLLAPISLAVLNPIAYVLLEIGRLRGHSTDSHENKNNPRLESSESYEREPLEERIPGTGGEGTSEGGDRSPKTKSGLKVMGMILLNIVTNPVMFMTVLGMIGNLFYSYIKFFGTVLDAFGSVFSTTALFLLGFRMVSSSRKQEGNALVTSGILIITKLLVLPLVTREIVSLLHTGPTANDTLNLSTFGFIYGTFPTAPMVFVLSSQYDIEIESISSSLVVCTFLSAPLMYISAKMIYMNFLPTDNYYQRLESFAFNLGAAGIPLGLWLLILFAANKSFSKVPHKITGFLIISQILVCVGVLMQPMSDFFKPWSSYLQFSVLAFGLYGSRLWTCSLAVTLVLLQSRSLCFVIKLLPAFIILAWGIPTVLVVAVCLATDPEYKFGSLMNPDFRHGKFQSVVTLLLLFLSFVVTGVCLILQHRYRSRFTKYKSLVDEVNSNDLMEVRSGRTRRTRDDGGDDDGSRCKESCSKPVTDIEEIATDTQPNVCSGDCKNEENLCSAKFSCTDVEREMCEQTIKQYNVHAINEEMDEDHQDQQIQRHIILLLLLVTSMFVNLMLSVWTLVVEDAFSGVYVELLFMNVILNIGQIFLTFAVFGFDTRNLLASISNRWRRFYYGAETVVLTPVENLGFETTHVCDQFITHHLRECEREIAKHKRLRLRLYKDCFKGKTLVSWLQGKRLAKDEVEAVQYAAHLLEGRVIRHIENRHHFENSDLLYTFRQ